MKRLWSFMKKFLIPLLLAVSSAVSAQVPVPQHNALTIFQKMDVCAFYSTKATEDSVLSVTFEPNEENKYLKMVVVDSVYSTPSIGMLKTLTGIAVIAWRNRGKDPTLVGVAVYKDCVKQILAADAKNDTDL